MCIIFFGVKRVIVNNLEIFIFIFFFLVFVIVVVVYVWIEGIKDFSWNCYKLFLECILIFILVVFFELFIELFLVVNIFFIVLVKFYMYCIEFFWIFFVGKVEVCCFDKMGILISDSLVVCGVVGLRDGKEVIFVFNIFVEIYWVLVLCYLFM